MQRVIRTAVVGARVLRTSITKPIRRPPFIYVPGRTFVAQILGVIANPFETMRQLDESRKLLEQTRQVQ